MLMHEALIIEAHSAAECIYMHRQVYFFFAWLSMHPWVDASIWVCLLATRALKCISSNCLYLQVYCRQILQTNTADEYLCYIQFPIWFEKNVHGQSQRFVSYIYLLQFFYNKCSK